MPDIDVSSLTSPLYIGNGSDRTKFEIDGTIVAEGAAVVYDDVIGQLTGAQLFETPGKADYDFDECAVMFQPSGSIAVDGDCVVMSFQIPHSAKVDAPFHFHAHYYQTDATARTFQYQYRVRSVGKVKPAWSSVVTVSTDTANALPYTGSPMDQIAVLGNLSLVGAGISARVQVRLARTDAVAGNLEVDYLDGHVEKDTIGSRQEYVK